MHLHHITTKLPSRFEPLVKQKPKKERNYLLMRKDMNSHEQGLLKQMVNKELEDETEELLTLAERVGYLDPKMQIGRQVSSSGFSYTKISENRREMS